MEQGNKTIPTWVSKKKIMEMFGVTGEFLDNQKDKGVFTFSHPKGTNVLFFKPQEIEAWIEKGVVV